MTVNIGLGIGSRENNLLHLNALWEKQMQMAQLGMMNLAVTPDNLYATAKEIAKNANMKNPDQFFTNPGGQAAPPPSQEQLQIQQQVMLLEQREKELQRRESQIDKTELQHVREMLKIAQDDKHHDDDIVVKLEQLQNDLTEMRLKYDKPVDSTPVVTIGT